MSHVIHVDQSFSLGNLSQILATMLAVKYPNGHQGDEVARSPPLARFGDPDIGRDATILETIGFIGGKHCSNVKKLFGVHYERVQGETEPDPSFLKMDFISMYENHSFYLRDLDTEVPNLRGMRASKPLILFLHGFTYDPSNTNFHLITDALLRVGVFHFKDYFNILTLDASPLIRWLYLRSNTYIRFIGERLGDTLAEMSRHGLDRKNIHLIGHSLGAHIAGYASSQFKKLTRRKVGRVTGLDPSGPCFAVIDEELKLDKRYADFVDVIHTNTAGYGTDSGNKVVGHADFFPNEGRKQPGCFFPPCSHDRAIKLYAESISDRFAFYTVRCPNAERWSKNKCPKKQSEMGFHVSTKLRGRFYLRTNPEEPFGLRSLGVIYEYGFINN